MKIIYIFPYSPTAWDGERFGFNFFIQKGIDFTVFDLSPIISTRSDKNNVFLQEPYIKKIFSYAQFEQEVKKAAEHTIFIDNINGLGGLQWKSRKILKIFKQYRVKYYLVVIGSLPLLANQNSKNFISKLKKSMNLKKLLAYSQWKLGNGMVNLQAKYFKQYQFPDKIFVGNTDLLPVYLHRYHLTMDRVVPIHSFDYDRYIQYLRTHQIDECQTEKTCVFLDQALAYHSDFGNSVSFSPVTAKKYIPSLNQFFDKIEREAGLEVVIAASPRSNNEYTKTMFGQRRVIKGKTLELVAQSALVLMHSSTAVSFAILFNKPILLLKTDEMSTAHGYGNFIDNMALSLGLKPIYIDRKLEMDQFDFSQYQTIEKNYCDYKYKYIMTEGLADITTWEIVYQTAILGEGL